MSPEPRRSISVDRHFLLFEDLLKGREHDRHSLAARLRVKPAMAHKLMKAALRLPGVIRKHDGRRLVIRMDATAIVPAPSYATAVAACLGSSLWALFEGSTYREGIREAFRDVIGRTKRRAVFRDIDRKFWFLRRGGEIALLDRSPLLDEVIEAVLHHRVLSLEYVRFSGTSKHLRAEPLSIVVHAHQLYVVARNEAGKLRPYRFSRIRNAEALDDTFQYPTRSEYNPEQVFRDSFGVFLDLPVQDVALKLHKEWTTYAQSHRWHDSQSVEVADDGVVVRLRVRVCPELESWILGFGEEAEVLAPVSLRTRIATRVAGLARIYSSSSAASSRPPIRKAAEPPTQTTAARR
jgi:predicted DNA-binding transcriptional regulator YafY